MADVASESGYMELVDIIDSFIIVFVVLENPFSFQTWRIPHDTAVIDV